MKPLPGMIWIFPLLLWNGVAAAHGPGKRLQAESGFCAPDGGMERRLDRTGVGVGQRQEICLALKNPEDQAMEIRLSLLEGEVMSQGVATCLDRAEGGDPGARLDGEVDVVRLEPGQRVERHLGVMPTRWGDHPAERGGAGFRGWLGCLLVRGAPVAEGKSASGGGHLKGFRTLHMMRLKGK